MKRIVIIAAILTSIIVFSVLGIANIASVKTDLNHTLDEVSYYIDREDYESANGIVQQMQTFWEKENELLDTYVKHDVADKIGVNIVKINVLINLRCVDELTVEIVDMRYNLQHLYEAELPLIGNIL